MGILPRNILAFSLAVLVTLGLFFSMQKMINGNPQRLGNMDDINVVQFIPYEPSEELPPEIPQKLPEPPKQIKPPETPLVETISPTAPSVVAPTLQNPNINLPLNMSGTPFIGVNAPSAGEGEAIPLVRIPPRYPMAAKRRKLSGKVVVEFTINEQGLVEHPVIVSAKPPRIFDNVVLQAILRWKFKPKIINGKAVKRKAKQEMTFEPK